MRREINERVVSIGGGTGSFTMLSELKKVVSDLWAVVAMTDSGGSSRRLMDEFGHPLPLGDLRQALVALARAQPGKLNYASAGVASPLHLAGELFKSLTQTQMTHVPYVSPGVATQDLLGGAHDLGARSKRQRLAARHLSRVYRRARDCRRSPRDAAAARQGWRANRRSPDASAHDDRARTRRWNRARGARSLSRRRSSCWPSSRR